MTEEEMTALVVDNEMDMYKIGFTCDDAPRAEFPSFIERSYMSDIMGHRVNCVRDVTRRKRRILTFRSDIWLSAISSRIGMTPFASVWDRSCLRRSSLSSSTGRSRLICWCPSRDARQTRIWILTTMCRTVPCRRLLTVSCPPVLGVCE